MFTVFHTPDGFQFREKVLSNRFKTRSRHILFIQEAFKRLNGFYRYSRTDMRRDVQDTDKTDFCDVFRETVPEPFCQDIKLACRMRDLCKFIQLTYHVKYSNKPFEALMRETTKEKYKRSTQKQIKLYHGV